MSNSTQLRLNKNQHIAKNKYSKKDDKIIFKAQIKVKEYLEDRFKDIFSKKIFYIEFDKNISYQTMFKIIKSKGVRDNFAYFYKDRTIKPDGGILYLRKTNDKDYKKILLVAETKRQGTNDLRKQEGKPKQARGNAIERLGKNLTGIKAMMNHEKITPFVCFGWGCDFDKDEDAFVLSKVVMLNEFYELNKIYVFKRDGDSGHNFYSPVSMYFRNRKWEKDEMFNIMKEIAETAFRHYTF